jgi:hypothetical protein
MTARGPFETLEGVVKRIDEKVLWFREDGAGRDLCIPLCQVRDAEYVKAGDIQIDVTRWILDKLEEEGRR